MALDAVATWRTVLTPWLKLLKGRVALGTEPLADAAPYAEPAWVRLHMPRADVHSPSFWGFVREALELLDILARIDHRACWTVLSESSSFQPNFPTDTRAFVLPEERPRYRLGISGNDLYENRFLELGCSLLGDAANPTHSPSPEYVDAKAQLMAVWRVKFPDGHGEEIDRAQHGRILIRAEFDIYSDLDEQTTKDFRQMCLIARLSNGSTSVSDLRGRRGARSTAATSDVSTTRRDRIFEFSGFRYDTVEWPLESDLLLALTDVARLIPLSYYELNAFMMSRLSRQVAGTFWLETLVPWPGRREGLGISTLSITVGEQYDRQAIQAIGSAMVQSRSLRQVRFVEQSFSTEASHPVFTEWWRWFAYAMFSADAEHEVHTVVIKCKGLQTTTVDAMKRVLAHPNPAALLMQQDTMLSDAVIEAMTRSVVQLKPQAFICLGAKRDYIDGSTQKIRVDEDEVWYRVVGDDPSSDHLHVLFPGSGLAWVERDAVSRAREPARREGHCVRYVKLYIGDDNADEEGEEEDGITDLMELIGGPVSTLSVQSDPTLSDDYITELVAACPRVERLELDDTRVESWSWLLELPSDCPMLTTLVIRRPWSRHDEVSDNLQDFLSRLGDSTQALNRQLRQLAIDWSRDDKGLTHELVDMMLASLSKNYFLERVVFETKEEALATRFADRFRAHDNEPLYLKEAPLSLQCKMALLSVLLSPSESSEGSCPLKKKQRRPSSTGPGGAGRWLSQEAFASIFAFAAVPRRRLCSFIYSGRRSDE